MGRHSLDARASEATLTTYKASRFAEPGYRHRVESESWLAKGWSPGSHSQCPERTQVSGGIGNYLEDFAKESDLSGSFAVAGSLSIPSSGL